MTNRYFFLNKIAFIGILLKSFLLFSILICFNACVKSDDYEIFAKIHGTVTDYHTGESLQNASVILSPSGVSKLTDENGHYQFEELDAQQYIITVQKSGYQPNRKTVTAISGEIQQVDIQLTVIPQ